MGRNNFPEDTSLGVQMQTMMDRIERLERAAWSGITVVDGGIIVAGTLEVDGSAAFVGNTTIGGNAAVTGTLSLPGGIINNDALASPSKPESFFFWTSNFAITTTATIKATKTVTVPAGFTSAVVVMNTRLMGINNNTTGGLNGAGADYLITEAGIAGSYSAGLSVIVLGSNSSNISVNPTSAVLTGLTPGGTFDLTLRVRTSFFTWAANGSTWDECSGIIIWYR